MVGCQINCSSPHTSDKDRDNHRLINKPPTPQCAGPTRTGSLTSCILDKEWPLDPIQSEKEYYSFFELWILYHTTSVCFIINKFNSKILFILIFCGTICLSIILESEVCSKGNEQFWPFLHWTPWPHQGTEISTIHLKSHAKMSRRSNSQQSTNIKNMLATLKSATTMIMCTTHKTTMSS